MAGLDSIRRGDTYELAIDLSAYGVSIVGHSLALTLKSELTDADEDAALAHLETVPDTAEGQAGRHLLSVPASSTDLIAPGKYHFDVQWTQPGSPDRVRTILASGQQPNGKTVPKLEVLSDVRRSVP